MLPFLEEKLLVQVLRTLIVWTNPVVRMFGNAGNDLGGVFDTSNGRNIWTKCETIHKNAAQHLQESTERTNRNPQSCTISFDELGAVANNCAKINHFGGDFFGLRVMKVGESAWS